MAVIERGLRETFASFFEDALRERLRDLLEYQVGAIRKLDFKADWPHSGSSAKHVQAMAKSGGGCVVIGVTEGSDKSLAATGRSAPQDKAAVGNALKKRIPAELARDVGVMDFAYDISDYAALAGERSRSSTSRWRTTRRLTCLTGTARAFGPAPSTSGAKAPRKRPDAPRLSGPPTLALRPAARTRLRWG